MISEDRHLELNSATPGSNLLSKLTHATAESAPLVPGRRGFFSYRDLGGYSGY
jgi:hypothetical protein